MTSVKQLALYTVTETELVPQKVQDYPLVNDAVWVYKWLVLRLWARSYSNNFTHLLVQSKNCNCWLGMNGIRAKRQSAKVIAFFFFFVSLETELDFTAEVSFS